MLLEFEDFGDCPRFIFLGLPCADYATFKTLEIVGSPWGKFYALPPARAAFPM